MSYDFQITKGTKFHFDEDLGIPKLGSKDRDRILKVIEQWKVEEPSLHCFDGDDSVECTTESGIHFLFSGGELVSVSLPWLEGKTPPNYAEKLAKTLLEKLESAGVYGSKYSIRDEQISQTFKGVTLDNLKSICQCYVLSHTALTQLEQKLENPSAKGCKLKPLKWDEWPD